MTTLADKEILSGADNRPLMLEKDMYDSWKSIMELYMMNRQHGRMILESVENCPLIWPTIEGEWSDLDQENIPGVICLPPQIYALVYAIIDSPKGTWKRMKFSCKELIDETGKENVKLYDGIR
ncbi:hypothetical protein Tco_1069690 [Tanacetum coccineum]|uniref:Uncharacterized protein n=1 Tax=Tanacetum coccineum TaxID=301880 RepID=A0ABQ5HJ97_9ASTR